MTKTKISDKSVLICDTFSPEKTNKMDITLILTSKLQKVYEESKYYDRTINGNTKNGDLTDFMLYKIIHRLGI